jgi:hypothetical protein
MADQLVFKAVAAKTMPGRSAQTENAPITRVCICETLCTISRNMLCMIYRQVRCGLNS